MDFTVNKSLVSIKFDYALMFKVNKALGTKNENGQSNGDGVGALFLKVVERDDTALVDLLTLCASKKGKAVSEEDVVAAVDAKLGELEAETTEPIFKELEDEMVASGFFKEKVLKYIENLEKVLPLMKARGEDDQTAEFQVKQVEEQIGKVKDALS